eukprot:4010323-Pyramimonas_sp.AAC.1
MDDQAEREVHKALQRDVWASSHNFMLWLSGTNKSTTGKLRRPTKSQPRHEGERIHARGQACCPQSIIDAKTDEFRELWAQPTLTHHGYVSITNDVREHAASAAATNWTLDDLDYSLRCSPDSGKGTDKITSSDLRRLPRAG